MRIFLYDLLQFVYKDLSPRKAIYGDFSQTKTILRIFCKTKNIYYVDFKRQKLYYWDFSETKKCYTRRQYNHTAKLDAEESYKYVYTIDFSSQLHKCYLFVTRMYFVISFHSRFNAHGKRLQFTIKITDVQCKGSYCTISLSLMNYVIIIFFWFRIREKSSRGSNIVTFVLSLVAYKSQIKLLLPLDKHTITRSDPRLI